MSKLIKQMEMDAIRASFNNVRDMVMMTASGVNCQEDHHFRASLRKKNIRLQVVKNSLARRVLQELGVRITADWSSPTLVAWGAGSAGELSREIETLLKKNEKGMAPALFAALTNKGRRLDKHGNPWRVYELDHARFMHLTS